MALIACLECRGEISDRATTCPHCGAPIVAEEIKRAAMEREALIAATGIAPDAQPFDPNRKVRSLAMVWFIISLAILVVGLLIWAI